MDIIVTTIFYKYKKLNEYIYVYIFLPISSYSFAYD